MCGGPAALFWFCCPVINGCGLIMRSTILGMGEARKSLSKSDAVFFMLAGIALGGRLGTMNRVQSILVSVELEACLTEEPYICARTYSGKVERFAC